MRVDWKTRELTGKLINLVLGENMPKSLFKFSKVLEYMGDAVELVREFLV